MPSLEDFSALLGGNTRPFVVLLVTWLVIAIGHFIVFGIACAGARRSGSRVLGIAFARLRWPSLFLLLLLAASALVRSLRFPGDMERVWPIVAGFLFPAFIGLLALACLRIFVAWVEDRSDISIEDNLAARRRRTRLGLLSRVGAFLILFISLAMMLLSVPSIRSVGITLMASAGLAGLAIGAAAQPLLKNLIAGIQMAFTEPIRIDDVVILDGEWGRIEQISLTYVVVALWDERRLVVPVSRFLEKPFENWTRSSSRILGSVFLLLDPAADVERVRRKADELLAASALWDGRVGITQVTDVQSDAIQVRVLVSAANAGNAFDLRCELREKLLAFVRSDMPEALPRGRSLVSGRLEIDRAERLAA